MNCISRLRSTSLPSLLLAGAVALAAPVAQAGVISFENIGSGAIVGHGSQTQDGMRFTSNNERANPQQFDLVGAVVDANYTNCYGYDCSGASSGHGGHYYAGLGDSSLTVSGAGALQLHSFEAALVTPSGGLPGGSVGMLQVTGMLVGGGSYSENFSLGAAFRSFVPDQAFLGMQFSSLKFSGFYCAAGGACVADGSNYNQFALDNINAGAVTAVPEPSAWLMLGLGLVGVVTGARRRRA